MPERQMSVGIIGCGTICRNVHLPVLSALPAVKVAWIADVNVKAGQSLSYSSGIPFHLISLPDISLPAADIVVLAIPNGIREPYYTYLESVPATCLYVEKPFAKTFAEHIRITRGRAPYQVAIGLDRRSFALTRLAQELFIQRPFGEVVSIDIKFGGLGRVLIGDSFMHDASLAGGGALFQMGVHFIDAVLFASNARDVQLQKGRLIMARGLDVHVEAQLGISLASEKVVPLTITITQLQAVTNSITIAFERAEVSFDIMYGGNHWLTVTPRSSQEHRWRLAPEPRTGPLDLFSSFGMHWQSAIHAFRSHTENYTSASQAVITSKTLELLYSIPREIDQFE